jgi:hypothetical protein
MLQYPYLKILILRMLTISLLKTKYISRCDCSNQENPLKFPKKSSRSINIINLKLYYKLNQFIQMLNIISNENSVLGI